MIKIRHIAMLVAEMALQKSNCNKRQVAFVLFDEKADQIIGVSVNEHKPDMPCKCVAGVHDPYVLHAEQILLSQHTAKGLSAVVTYGPCIECAGAIVSANIKDLHIKQIKHTEGLDVIKKRSPETIISTDRINDQQRIQAKWLVKNVFNQHREVFKWLVSTK